MADIPIPLCEPCLDDSDARLLAECLASTYVSSVGPFVDRFEREFAAAVSARHAVACASGTAAIHLALRVLGVGRGDLVLCSDFTFIASANPIEYQGAEAAFVDSEERSWNMDPSLLRDAIAECVRAERRPKAVIVVHVLGQPADLGPIIDECRRHEIPVIEDAAEALGATYDADNPHPDCRGRSVGTIGDIGCFSFNGNKIITTGGGGMLTTSDETLARRLKHLSTQAKLPGAAFVHDDVGYNYRLTNLAASLGIAQLARLSTFLERKRRIAGAYRETCARLGIAFQPHLAGTSPSDWLPSVELRSAAERDGVLREFSAAGIGARPLWLPLSAQAPYRAARVWKRGVGDRLAARGVSLPCSVGLPDAALARVCAGLAAAVSRAAATKGA